ncbi:MAG: hypothetical protein IJY01_00400 [Clostridia bacterium]|nr:hypothetical protein [Clostridia bacterium]
MKKIIVFILALTLIASLLTIPSLALSSPDLSNEVGAVSPTDSTPENENATEGEISGESDIPFTQKIVNFITDNYTGSSLIALAVTVVTYLFYAIKSGKKLTGTITKLNNNSVNIAQTSTANINDVTAFKGQIQALLARFEKTEEEKANLEEMLSNVTKFINASKLATIEMSNEVAELLVLANIPNAVKDEILARHNAAVKAINAAEGGNSDDGQKA